jgi:hypothetical protein
MPDHAIQVILRGLHFEGMENHHARPLDRHPGTYDWIFDRSSCHVVCDACTQMSVTRRCNCQRYEMSLQRQATKIRTWLETPDGIFWIQGKVGAGKSTFMKFLKDKEGSNSKAMPHTERAVMVHQAGTCYIVMLDPRNRTNPRVS